MAAIAARWSWSMDLLRPSVPVQPRVQRLRAAVDGAERAVQLVIASPVARVRLVLGGDRYPPGEVAGVGEAKRDERDERRPAHVGLLGIGDLPDGAVQDVGVD